MQERELVEGIKKKDRKAFNALMDLYGPRIFNMALRMLGNRQDAEDILQETFLTVINKIDQFKGKSTIYTWIYRIAVNHALAKIRDTSRFIGDKELSDPNFERIYQENSEEMPGLDKKVLTSRKFRKIIDEAVQSLPEIYRSVFVLRDLQGLSTEETAQVLNISVSNVKIRLMRARNFLRDKLDPRIREYEIV